MGQFGADGGDWVTRAVKVMSGVVKYTNMNTNTNTFISGKNPYTIGIYIRTSK